MKPQSHDFVRMSADALANAGLQQAMGLIDRKFVAERRHAVEALPEFETLRDRAVELSDHTLAHLDLYLERFATAAEANGAQLHFAADAEAAQRMVTGICSEAKARSATKSKSMTAEEIDLNAALDGAGISRVETDLGEYILQLADEPPSHIVAPAYHKSKASVAALFAEHHGHAAPRERGQDLVAEARHVLRRRYFAADVAITGANALIAETGQAVLVTNEGNADLGRSLARVHIVLAGIDKLVPTLDDAGVLLRLLARSATGQDITMYTSLVAGPRRQDELDGPDAVHVILLDNGRTGMLASERLRPLLRCIRCGACMNHCPVYASVGGHAYGWVYPGPLGAALDPALIGLDEARHLPQASTLCGACEEVCPVRIPLPMIFRHWREQAFARRIGAGRERWGVRAWAWLATRPRLYRLAMRAARGLLRAFGRKGAIRRLPLAGGWTGRRDMPAPQRSAVFNKWLRGR